MSGIFTYIVAYSKSMVNVGKYSIHGAYGMYNFHDQNLSDLFRGPISKARLYTICFGVIFLGPKTNTNQNLVPLDFDHTVWGICLVKLNNYFLTLVSIG